jgi:hypothetical protein
MKIYSPLGQKFPSPACNKCILLYIIMILHVEYKQSSPILPLKIISNLVLNILYSQLYEWDWATDYAYTNSLLTVDEWDWATDYAYTNSLLTVDEWDWATGYAYTNSLLFTFTRYTFSNKCLSIHKLYQ